MNLDQRVRLLVGELQIQLLALLVENEALKAQLAAAQDPVKTEKSE